MGVTHPSLTYADYLKIDELLALQQPRSDGPEHDEMLFIVIHQVYELWFKQVLWELDHAVGLLDADDQATCGHTLNRVLRILKVMVVQMDVLETMTPLEFGSFRARLDSASGFQSGQFRELEALLGTARPDVVDHFPTGSPVRGRLVARLTAPTMWAAFCNHLARRGFDVPARCLVREPGHQTVADDDLQQTLLAVYRDDATTANLCERLVDLDEGIQEWRYRHVKMVERTIGTKPGTGGSQGAAYLHTTLGRPVFPDLWAIRARF
ncbi:MAG: tryptophan 2,3-dioxygenase [Ilumatobacteraceae bacterium]